MHAFGAQKADVQRGILRRLKGKPKAHLDSIGRRVILVEAHDGRVAKEAAAGDGATRTEAERRRVRVGTGENTRQRDRRNVRSAGKGEEPRGGVQRVAVGSRVGPRSSTTRRLLARQ